MKQPKPRKKQKYPELFLGDLGSTLLISPKRKTIDVFWFNYSRWTRVSFLTRDSLLTWYEFIGEIK